MNIKTCLSLFFSHPIVLLVMRWSIAGVFLYAGWQKVVAPLSFADSIASFELLPPVVINVVALSLPPFEILLAGALVVPFKRRAAAVGLLMLVLVFMLALASAMMRGIAVDCGCFGSEDPSSAAAGHALLRDIPFLLALLWLFSNFSKKDKGMNTKKWTLQCRPFLKVMVGGWLAHHLGVSVLACGLNWQPMGTHLDACDSSGFVVLTERLADLKIPGEEDAIRVDAVFSSAHTTPSPYAGLWRIGILEMSLIPINENEFLMRDPGGNETTLRRNRKDRSIIEGPGWKGSLLAAERIKLWASCGWSVEFQRGKVTRMTTAHNKTLLYNYVDGRMASITCDGKPLVSLGKSKGDVLDMTIGEKKLSLICTNQPRVQTVGKTNIIRGMDKTLAEIRGGEGWEGYKRTFAYSVDDKTQPVITITEGNQPPFSLSWNPQTRKILRYKDWEYAPTRPRKSNWDVIDLRRKNSAGQVEVYYYNIDAGVSITEREGVKSSVYRFTSGPAAGKIRKTEDMRDGKVTNLQQYFYDEKGRVVRGKENADTLLFKYDDQNHTEECYKNGILQWKKAMDDKGRILNVWFADGKELRLKYKEALLVSAELVSSNAAVSVQVGKDGLIKDGSELIKYFTSKK